METRSTSYNFAADLGSGSYPLLVDGRRKKKLTLIIIPAIERKREREKKLTGWVSGCLCSSFHSAYHPLLCLCSRSSFIYYSGHLSFFFFSPAGLNLAKFSGFSSYPWPVAKQTKRWVHAHKIREQIAKSNGAICSWKKNEFPQMVLYEKKTSSRKTRV